jgi:hypothetical protein
MMHVLGIGIFAVWAIATAVMDSFTAGFGRGPGDQIHTPPSIY